MKPLLRFDENRRRCLDRSGPSGDHDGGARGRSQGPPPRDRGRIRKAISTYRMGRRTGRTIRRGGRAAAPAVVVAQFKQWTARELDLQREAARPPSSGRIWTPARLLRARRSTGGGPRGGADLEWLDGIKLNDHDALTGRGPDAGRPPAMSRPSLPPPGGGRRLLPRRSTPRKPVRAARRTDCRHRLRDHGPDRPTRTGLARRRSSTA